MEGAPSDKTSTDPPMTPIERQMQVIATSIQDFARETSRQNQELWQAIKKGPPTPRDNNQPLPQGENGSNDQEADNRQITRRREDEVEKTPPQNKHRARVREAPPLRVGTGRLEQLEEQQRSSKQHERSARSAKQPDHSSRQPNRLARSSRSPDDKTARLEEELREMRKQMGDMKNSLKAKAARNLDNLVHRADSPFIPRIANFPLPSGFKVPLLENFDGTKDPFDYLEAFKTIIQLQAVPEEIMCRAFPMGLRGSARSTKRATAHSFARNQANGGRVIKSIHPLETLSELMYEAQKHMNAEDALEAMDDPPPKRGKDTEDRKQEPAKQKVPKFTETLERKRTTAPPMKFSSFTPLNTPIDILLLQIQDDPSLRWPGKIRSDPNSRPKNLYCRFHRDHGHLTEDCIALKEQMEALIRQVHNIMVVQKPPKNARLGDQVISFSEEYARGTHQPHDDALVVTINVAGFITRQVMIDNGSSADILYLPTYQQIRLDKDKLRPMDAPLVGFTGDKVCPVGIVTLPIIVGTHPKTVSKIIDFLVVNCPSAYNAIIERPTLNRLRAMTSTYHLLLKFPTEHKIGEVRGDQVAARECYLASLGSEGQNQTMAIEEQKILVESSEELDTIVLEDGQPEKTTKIGSNLPPKLKESLVQFMKKNKDVFAWSHENMPGINPSIISHKLNVNPSLRPVKQKQRVFALERNEAIMEEVDKLLTANFIREVFYPDWLANVVMVKKSTGK
uniref:Retrotransposon gag domain-containing protein n=1 Tax=Fagus sylvatica TaxID=28930 RepID=A0A2N9HJA8_FAGSY